MIESIRALSEDGTVIYLNSENERHREDGPAQIFPDGSRLWYRNDELHREDGPAIVYSDGREEWYINGVKVPKELVEKKSM